MAWHFVGETLRDGSSIPPDGETLVYAGELDMCRSGLHASRRILDALWYAPGTTICRVKVGGDVIHANDKLVASERTILWRVDGKELLKKFARMCALDVLDKRNAPDFVVRYLKTGGQKLASHDAWAAWAAPAAAASEAAGHADAAWAARAAWAAWTAGHAWAVVAAEAAWAACAARHAEAAAGKQNRRLERMVLEARG